MKWITHQAGALAAAVWFQADAVTTAAMLGGAVLPDAAEMLVTRGNPRLFQRIHRGVLHWFGLYAALLAAACVAPLPAGEQAAAVGLALGALSHLILDGLNPSGVPLVPWRKVPRFRWPLVATGSPGECLVFLALLGTAAAGGYTLDPAWLRRIPAFFAAAF